MDSEDKMYKLLEGILLNDRAEARDLPFSLLKAITVNFSDELLIGLGGFGAVYKGFLGNRIVAVKKLFQTLEMDEEKFNREVTCLVKVKHKNIVRLLGYCADTQGKIFNFQGGNVMAEVRQRLLCFEYMGKGSLDNYIKDTSQEFDWTTRYQIIMGICEGLHYLHQMRIVHSDLKPANILLDNDMVPKIADFGLSRCFNVQQSHTITSKPIGSYGYMAPEFQDGRITYESDIYSLGVIVIELLTGQKGYHALQNVHESWKNKLNASHGDKQLEQVSVCAELAIKCIDYDPVKRPVTWRIVERLKETECKECIIGTGFSTSGLPHHVDMYSAIELQRLIPEDTRETNSKVQNRKHHIQDPTQRNIILRKTDSHARAPRLLRVYELYRRIPHSTRVRITCGFVIFALTTALIFLLSAYGIVRQVSISVEDASLRRFTLSTSPPIPTLAYNLSMTIAISNPNWAISIENVKPLDVSIIFDGAPFDRIQLSGKGEKQAPGKTLVYHLQLSSNNTAAALGNSSINMFEYGNAAGVFHLELNLVGMVRYTAHITKCKLEASCPFILQQYPPRWPMIMFEKVQCRVRGPDKLYIL